MIQKYPVPPFFGNLHVVVIPINPINRRRNRPAGSAASWNSKEQRCEVTDGGPPRVRDIKSRYSSFYLYIDIDIDI